MPELAVAVEALVLAAPSNYRFTPAFQAQARIASHGQLQGERAHDPYESAIVQLTAHPR
jgi:hypothetical protein